MDNNGINYEFLHKVDKAYNDGRNVGAEAVKYFRNIVKVDNEIKLTKAEKNKGNER